ncbi:MAG TPA: 1-acyl-sn-glycerol-3-phosphate acyltransferase, partial [bacterium]|nr:1-acyl-sn-glycerol-3-phosphate acyltransferase [bacterium]
VELSDYIRQSGHDDSGTLARDLLASIEEDWRVEKARVTGASLKPKEALIKDILNDPELGARVGVFAKDHKLKPEDCLRDVQRYLDEVGADVNYSYLQFAHITLRHLWTKIFDGVSVKPDQLNRIREVAGKYPVVLVPMHRSHIDYLLISDLFYEHNITFPYVCGGINLNFWPVGRLIRKCGGFFIRRNFKGNYLYKEAVSAYVRALISQGHCLEFFIEGTRSRTGRQLSPKMGILSMVLRAYLEGACEDLYFVPIAVNYDHILEERSYQSEGTGDEKKQENAQELLKVRKVFKKKYGKVYIEFAEPISLKDYCRQHGLEQRPIDELKNEVAALAFTLTDKMTHVALVTPMTLVSTAVLSLNKKAFT